MLQVCRSRNHIPVQVRVRVMNHLNPSAATFYHLSQDFLTSVFISVRLTRESAKSELRTEGGRRKNTHDTRPVPLHPGKFRRAERCTLRFQDGRTSACLASSQILSSSRRFRGAGREEERLRRGMDGEGWGRKDERSVGMWVYLDGDTEQVREFRKPEKARVSYY